MLDQPATASPALVEAPSPASPAEGPAPADSTSRELLSAEVLMTSGRTDDAREILHRLEARKDATQAEENQIQFLLGMLDLQDKDYESAIHHFHLILISEPKAVRVRLELGRAYYLAGDYGNAQRQLLFARAAKLPPNVTANIDRYLGAIRYARKFSYTLTLSMASDSNINAGPATDTVSLYGLPFQLSHSAKANSGVGLAIDAGMEWDPRLNRSLQWRLGAQLHRSQYRQTRFDDMTMGIYSGPHLVRGKWDLDLTGRFARRWYGERTYADMAGGSLGATYFVKPHLGIGAALNLVHFDYAQNPRQSGLGGNVGASFFYTPTTASILRGSASLGWQDARDRAFANHTRQFGLSYGREFKGGLSVSIAPYFTRIAYDAPLAAFGERRIDRQFSGQLALLYRRIDWHGFTPRVAYTYTRQSSSIPLYSFTRNRFEVGLTSAF